jgi:pantetheine-phosphate adenylyltransferase
LKRIALYPGTFDPVTNGHIDIMYRASSLCDTLIIGVAENIGKNPFFTVSERKALIEDAIKNNSKSSNRTLGEIIVKSFDNLLIDFARTNSVTMIIRGLRAVSDFDYEFQMAGMNARLASDIETVFLTASESNQFVASRFVKEIALLGGDISSFVPSNVAVAIENKKNF